MPRLGKLSLPRPWLLPALWHYTRLRQKAQTPIVGRVTQHVHSAHVRILQPSQAGADDRAPNALSLLRRRDGERPQQCGAGITTDEAAFREDDMPHKPRAEYPDERQNS
jgi:hypothetical protein